MSRFISLKDKGRNYLDTLTGETVSKRQRDKALRSVFSEKPISNEAAARLNIISNPELALARPARGRKSVLKASEAERKLVVEARKEDLKRRQEIAAEQKELRALERRISRASLKKVKRGTIRPSMLVPGRKAARVNFNNYKEYLELFEQVYKYKSIIEAYMIGVVGYHENTGEPIAFFMGYYQAIQRPPYSEEKFDDMVQEALEDHTYFHLTHFMMQVGFYEAFYKSVKAKALASGNYEEINNRVIKKGKKRKSKRK